MGKKLSIDAKWVGWYLIVLSSLYLLTVPMLYAFRDRAIYFPVPFRVISIIAGILMVARLIAGIQILKLKEFGRKLFLSIVIIDIPRMIVRLILLNNIRSLDKSDYFRFFFISSIELFFFYFLTRPKVKEQFK